MYATIRTKAKDALTIIHTKYYFIKLVSTRGSYIGLTVFSSRITTLNSVLIKPYKINL